MKSLTTAQSWKSRLLLSAENSLETNMNTLKIVFFTGKRKISLPLGFLIYLIDNR